MEIKIKFKTVDEYLSALPPKAKAMMKELRDTIKQAAPEAEEAATKANNGKRLLANSPFALRD